MYSSLLSDTATLRSRRIHFLVVGQFYFVPITSIVPVEIERKIAGKHSIRKIEKPPVFYVALRTNRTPD